MEVTEAVVTELFKQCHPALVASAVRFLGDTETSRDIVSDCFLGLWTHRSRYLATDCKRILFSSVRNRCLNELTRRRRLCRNQDLYLESIPISESIEEAIYSKDLSLRIYRWMDSLPYKRRQICKLTYFHGMSNPQTSLELGIGIATVVSQRRRMTVALKKTLYV